MALDALILDLGNVLVFHDNVKLFAEMGKLFGFESSELKARLDDGFWPRVNRGQLPGEALVTELNARLGTQASAAAFNEVWNCHFTLNTEMVRRVEGLVGSLRLVLLSNTHDLHIQYLKPRLPVLEQFDGLVLSCELGFVKPEKEMYVQALKAAAVPAHRAAFFDDIDSYARAASSVGITGRVFTTVAAFDEQLALLRMTDH